MPPNYKIHEAEILEWLKQYSGPRYHGIVSDPPYALISITKRFGKDGSAPAQQGSDGRFSRLSSGFMGQNWDGFDSLEQYQEWVSAWSELLIEKALHPGAVCLFFGGTRTFHHLGVGLERGGFEIVDCLMWLHGQGFPKSHNISKGLDKAAGAERAVVGVRSYPREGTTPVTRKATSIMQQGKSENVGQESNLVTAPATPQAEVWSGYGTALKPAWEPIYLCRAPRGKHTFAKLAVEYGSGALNIDGSRISATDQSMLDSAVERVIGNEVVGFKNFIGGSKSVQPKSAAGRWPANLTLSHSDECVKVGEFEARGRTINRFERGMMPFGNAQGEDYQSEQMPPETAERWACVSGCPVRMLNDQAGELKLGGEVGPSRFFYTAKASRSEKDKGLDSFYWKRAADGFERVSANEWEALDKNQRARGCIHPTIKPIKLTSYLAKLILPPDSVEPRRLFVPFSGSGSEIIGGITAGWDEIEGVEMSEQYNDIARARIVAVKFFE